MNKQKKKLNTRVWAIVIIVILLSIFLFIFQKRQYSRSIQKPSPSTLENKYNKYHSDILKITLDVPREFNVSEIYTTINIEKNKKLIQVSSNGTNYPNLDDYVDDLNKANKLNVISSTKTVINNLKSIREITKNSIENGPNYVTYFFYPKPWTIISISTNSPDLYSDLDQIAQSFRYNP